MLGSLGGLVLMAQPPERVTLFEYQLRPNLPPPGTIKITITAHSPLQNASDGG